MTHRSSRPRDRRRGVTMVEVIISTTLVGVVLVAALDTVGVATRATRARGELGRGERYAAELMAEIMAMPYSDPEADGVDDNYGIEADEPSPAANRSAFDDTDDYDDWVEASGLAWRDGATRADTPGWRRTAVVEKIQPNTFDETHANDNSSDRGSRLITVTVTSPGGDVTTLRAIRAQTGAMEQAPSLDTTFVTAVTIELRAASGAASGAAAVLNHASGP